MAQQRIVGTVITKAIVSTRRLLSGVAWLTPVSQANC
jgi:hypothetical protein